MNPKTLHVPKKPAPTTHPAPPKSTLPNPPIKSDETMEREMSKKVHASSR